MCCIHSNTHFAAYPALLSDLCVPATASHLRSSTSAIRNDWHSTSSTRQDCNWTTKFRSQRTSHVEPSATSTTVARPVGERLQAGTEDAPVLDCLGPFRRLHEISDLLTYLRVSIVCLAEPPGRHFNVQQSNFSAFSNYI